MLCHQYDHDFQRNLNNGSLQMKRHDNFHHRPKELSQSNENWLRRSERARQFTYKRKMSRELSEVTICHQKNIIHSPPTTANSSIHCSNEDTLGGKIKCDKHRSKGIQDDVGDSLVREGSQTWSTSEYSLEKDFWDDEDDVQINCFSIFVPILDWFLEVNKIWENAQKWADHKLKKTVQPEVTRNLLELDLKNQRSMQEAKYQEVCPIEKEKEVEQREQKDFKKIPLHRFVICCRKKGANQDVLKNDEVEQKDDSSSIASFSSASIDAPILTIPVKLIHEEPEVVLSSPHILSLANMNELKNHLPPLVQLMSWERAYSLSRDGDFFNTMLNKIEGFKYTLMVIKTMKGEILGGFADGNWQDDARKKSQTYFGGGLSFLFHFVDKSNKTCAQHEGNLIDVDKDTTPQNEQHNKDDKENNAKIHIVENGDKENQEQEQTKKDREEHEHKQETNAKKFTKTNHEVKEKDKEKQTGEKDSELKVYKWTGINSYCQLCDVTKGMIAMGGGGCFGLTLGKWFLKGTTGKCETFENPPLSVDETFDVWEFEMYGFCQNCF